MVEVMTTDDGRRHVAIDRAGPSTYLATNARGGTLSLSDGRDDSFTPVELLMVAIAGCTAIDVDLVTSRRAEPEAFQVAVDAVKDRDERGNHLRDIVVTFRVAFPDGDDGDKARAVLPDIVRKSRDRLCTVSRTIELGTPIATTVE
jgi:putative redox protein